MPFPRFARISGPNYVSPTGFGSFYPTYFPDLGVLQIKVKVLWNWVDHSGAHPAWNGGSQAAFSTAFRTNVPRAWNGKWRFRCRAAGYAGAIAEPRFVIEDGTLADHHFQINVRNCPGQSALNATNGQLLLHATDNDEYDNINPPNLLNPAGLFSMSRGGVLHNEREKVAQLLAPVQNVTLARTGFGWVVDPASRGALDAFADGLKRVGSLAPKYPLTVHATSGSDGKAGQLVQAVMDYLATRGVTPAQYPIATATETTGAKWKRPFKGHKATASAWFELTDEATPAVAAGWRYRYKVANHEFGHCLGLPDEYTTYPPGVIGNAHNLWAGLCGQAGVPANPYPGFNASIMSCGWTTSACHYVTVWQALGNLTRVAPYNIAPTDWVIERGSQPDVL